jgi:Head domain of trimeric autotransporter adhesin
LETHSGKNMTAQEHPDCKCTIDYEGPDAKPVRYAGRCGVFHTIPAVGFVNSRGEKVWGTWLGRCGKCGGYVATDEREGCTKTACLIQPIGMPENNTPMSPGNFAFAAGYRSLAIGTAAVAIGYEAKALANYSVALGYHAVAEEPGSIALGRYLVLLDDGSILIAGERIAAIDPRYVEELRKAIEQDITKKNTT